MADPEQDEVAAAVEQVWSTVGELASTPEGMALMEAARGNYPEHDD